MREIIGLRAGDGRSGVDAYLDFTVGNRRYAVPIELKSTTVGTVSTARDVGRDHIEKWRSRVWVVGFYEPHGSSLESLLALGPGDMEPWIARVENYIARDFMIGERVGTKLDLDDLYVICGEKEVYVLDDARALYKRQWSEGRYSEEMDLPGGYSPARMLDILRLRARYLIDRGSTLNNPHIPRRFFAMHADQLVDAGVGRDHLRRRIRGRIREVAMANARLRRIATALAQ